MSKKLIISLALLLCLNAYSQELNQQDVQRFSSYYSNGMEYLKNQQYSSAIVEFRKVLRFSPYDAIVQGALANTYFSRAQYYRQTTKEIKKAVVDYKSAYFYAKLWSKALLENSFVQLANTSHKDIIEFEKRMGENQDPDSRLMSAKVLRAQGELAAAAYDFYQLIDTKYGEVAYENLTNIFKNLNNVSMAMDCARKTLEINPKNAKMHFTYGVMLDEARNYEASMEQYNLALQYGDKSLELMEILENKWTQNIVNNPSNAQNYINLGAIYQKQGHFEGAKTQYLKAIQLDDSDDTAFYNLASLYIQQKNYQGAMEIYNKLLAKHPNNIEIIGYKAQVFYDAQKYDDALRQYEAILNIEPNNKTAKEMTDEIIYNKFDNTKLLYYLESHAQNNPKSYDAQFNYALELHKNKKYAPAVENYKKALDINPAKEEPYINLAQIYIEQNDYKNAVEICEKGLLMMPDNRNIQGYLANAKSYSMNQEFDSATKLYEEGKYEEAIKQYQAIPKKTKEVNTAIASCYWQLNDFENANKYYLEVLKSEPNNKDILSNIAYAYYSMQDYNNAKATAQKILALDKNNKQALEMMSNIADNELNNVINEAIGEYEKKNFNNALTIVNKVLSKKADNKYALYYKALCLDELKKQKEAGWIYRLLIQKHPDFADGYYSYAINLDNQENYKEAVTYYEKFINMSKENSDMKEFATSRVKELKTYLGQLNGKK